MGVFAALYAHLDFPQGLRHSLVYMKKAVLYARVSSDLQRKEKTIDSQILELKKQIVDAGDVLVKEYVDDGYSGARLDRPALDQFRKDLKTNLFETIYFLNTDRIARDVTYQNIILGEIIKAKKQIIINGKDYVNNPENKFTLTVLGAVSELERAKIIERVTRGKQLRITQGFLIGCGNNILGYDFVRRTPTSPAKMVINKREAEIVRYIFTEYAKGNRSMGYITHNLEDAGKLTKTGKKLWTYSKLTSLMKNPTYTGVRYYNTVRIVREYANPVTHTLSSKKAFKRDKKDWVGVTIPAIISQALFDRVQERLEWNRKHYRNPKNVHLLSSLVRCGHCGCTIFGYDRRYTDSRMKDSKKVYHREAYRCSWKVRRYMHSKKSDVRKCESKETLAHFLEDQVFAIIKTTMLDPVKIRKHIDFFKEKTQTAQLRLEKELGAIEVKITKLGEKKKRVIEVYASGDLARDAYVKKMLEYDNEINKLKKDRSDNLKRIPLLHKTEIINDSIDQFCEAAKFQYENSPDVESKRKFLLDYVEKITYYNDKIILHGVIPVKIRPRYAVDDHILDSETNKIEFQIERRRTATISVRTARTEG
jgi:site-specific DNA recombinase